MIKKFLFSLFLGFIATLFIAQYDPWVQQQVGLIFKENLQKALQCTFSFKVKSVNFFVPEIKVEDVFVQPEDPQQWSWHCKKYTCGFSWFDLIFDGALALWAQVDDFEMTSIVRDQSLAIMPHIEQLLAGPLLPVPAYLKSLSLKKGQMHISDESTGLDAVFLFKTESKKIDTSFKTTAYLLDGSMSSFGRSCMEHIMGTIKFDAIDREQGLSLAGRLECSFEMPQLDEDRTCLLSGTWENAHGRFSLHNLDHSLLIDPIIITKQHDQPVIRINGQFPLSYMWRIACNKNSDQHIKGQVFINLQANLGNKKQCDGHVIIEDVSYNAFPICTSAKISGFQRQNQCQGTISAHINSMTELSGSFNWDEQTKLGTMQIANNNMMSISQVPYWFVGPQDLHMHMAINDTNITAGYACKAQSTIRDTHIISKGDANLCDGMLQVQGILGEHLYELHALIQPEFLLNKFIYTDAQHKPFISLQSEVTAEEHKKQQNSSLKTIKGTIYYPFIRFICAHKFAYDLQGEGALELTSSFDFDCIALTMHLAHGTIRLPQTYNFIDGFDAKLNYDFKKNLLVLDTMQCSLHEGTIKSKHAVAQFDRDRSLAFIHLPIQFERCMLNVNHDLFAMVSGSILLSKQLHDVPHFKGRLILDRVQVKENILSDVFQKQLFQFTSDVFDVGSTDMACDVTVQTKYPIRIDTAFLEGSAKVNLAVTRSISDPEVTGSISLLSGSLKFPYKPLHIHKGNIYFLPDQLYNPMVELSAHNKIKKYNVRLHVAGSLQNHHILLESTPLLTEEQLISLLLVGSEEESLNALMPALVMQNMQQLIFGSNQTFLLDKYFNRLPRLFSIHLLPSFIDQTGRGGIRGALEIDVSDRWRALIQKNFSLTEDTRFELEYLLSDDITLRAIRDERRDVGGEIEMRWKF